MRDLALANQGQMTGTTRKAVSERPIGYSFWLGGKLIKTYASDTPNDREMLYAFSDYCHKTGIRTEGRSQELYLNDGGKVEFLGSGKI